MQDIQLDRKLDRVVLIVAKHLRYVSGENRTSAVVKTICRHCMAPAKKTIKASQNSKLGIQWSEQ